MLFLFNFIGKIQSLKKTVPKGDKKKKKEVSEEITRLETEMEKRHDEELAQLSSSNANANVRNSITSFSYTYIYFAVVLVC